LSVSPTQRASVQLPDKCDRDFHRLDRVRAARPTGTIDSFLHSLDGKVKRKKPLSIDDINRIAAAGWAGNLDQT
jgi:hypothetical protein